MKSDKVTYIYYLLDPRVNYTNPGIDESVYVGKAVNPIDRLRKHLYGFGRSHKTHWIDKLAREGLTPRLVIKCVCIAEEARRIEIALIRRLRVKGCRVMNTADGGEGGNTGPVSAETHRKLSVCKLGDRNNSKRPDVRAKLRIAALNVKPEILAKRNAAVKLSWIRRKLEGKVGSHGPDGRFISGKDA